VRLDRQTRASEYVEREQTDQWWWDYQDSEGYGECWECGSPGIDWGCYWCGFPCPNDLHELWVDCCWEYDNMVCQQCLIPRRYIPTDLELLAALGERRSGVTLGEILGDFMWSQPRVVETYVVLRYEDR